MNSTQFLFRITRLVWYVFYLIETLLLLRFVLELFGANPDAPFTHFIYSVSGALMSPLGYVFGPLSFDGSSIDINALLAIIVYWILAWAGVSLVLLNRDVDESEASRELRAQDNGSY